MSFCKVLYSQSGRGNRVGAGESVLTICELSIVVKARRGLARLRNLTSITSFLILLQLAKALVFILPRSCGSKHPRVHHFSQSSEQRLRGRSCTHSAAARRRAQSLHRAPRIETTSAARPRPGKQWWLSPIKRMNKVIVPITGYRPRMTWSSRTHNWRSP